MNKQKKNELKDRESISIKQHTNMRRAALRMALAICATGSGVTGSMLLTDPLEAKATEYKDRKSIFEQDALSSVKEEILQELVKQIKAAIVNEDEEFKEIKELLFKDFKEELKEEYQEELKSEIKEELRAELKEELKAELKEEILQELAGIDPNDQAKTQNPKEAERHVIAHAARKRSEIDHEKIYVTDGDGNILADFRWTEIVEKLMKKGYDFTEAEVIEAAENVIYLIAPLQDDMERLPAQKTEKEEAEKEYTEKEDTEKADAEKADTDKENKDKGKENLEKEDTEEENEIDSEEKDLENLSDEELLEEAMHSHAIYAVDPKTLEVKYITDWGNWNDVSDLIDNKLYLHCTIFADNAIARHDCVIAKEDEFEFRAENIEMKLDQDTESILYGDECPALMLEKYGYYILGVKAQSVSAEYYLVDQAGERKPLKALFGIQNVDVLACDQNYIIYRYTDAENEEYVKFYEIAGGEDTTLFHEKSKDAGCEDRTTDRKFLGYKDGFVYYYESEFGGKDGKDYKKFFRFDLKEGESKFLYHYEMNPVMQFGYPYWVDREAWKMIGDKLFVEAVDDQKFKWVEIDCREKEENREENNTQEKNREESDRETQSLEAGDVKLTTYGHVESNHIWETCEKCGKVMKDVTLEHFVLDKEYSKVADQINEQLAKQILIRDDMIVSEEALKDEQKRGKDPGTN